MALSILADGSQLAGRTAPSAVEATSRAEEATVGMASIPAEDPAADLVTTGHRPLSVSEDSCPSARLWTGWSADRGIGRAPDDGLLAGTGARLQSVAGVDLNAALGFRIIGADGQRPAESIDSRMAWLLGCSAMTGLVADRGHVHTGFADTLDASDLRGQTPAAVLSEMAEALLLRPNWFVHWDPAAGLAGLCWGRSDEATIGDSALSVSNVQSDWSGTCRPPSLDARLSRTPEDVYSDVAVTYAGGMVWVSNPAAAAAFTRRGTTLSRPRIQTAAAAERAGQQFLVAHAAERDRITLSLLVPAEQAGLVLAGQRIPVRLSEMPGYADWTSMHVAACSPRPASDVGDWWTVDLELISPAPWTAEPLHATLTEIRLRHGESCARDWGVPGATMGSGTPEAPATGHVGHHPATSGPVEYVVTSENRCGEPLPVAVRVLGAGTVDVRLRACAIGVGEVKAGWDILRNGVAVATSGHADYGPGLGFRAIACDMSAAVRAEPGDVISAFYYQVGGLAYLSVDDMAWGAPGETFLEVAGSAVAQLPGAVHSTAPYQAVHAPAPPGPGDGSDRGLLPGQLWLDTSTGTLHVLVDGTPGAAVWAELPAGAASSVSDGRPLGLAPAVGTSPRFARADHSHGTPGPASLAAAGVRGELLVSDDPAGLPISFGDLVLSEDGADLLYADLEVAT